MANLICLKDLEEPHIYHSLLKNGALTGEKSYIYCVLAENALILFKNASDIISLFRIPLNKNTRVEFIANEFTVTYNDFNFTFSHKDLEVIETWKKEIKKFREKDIQELMVSFHAEVAVIEKIHNKNECSIVISKTGYRLFIYQSFIYQKSDICTHVINLKFYRIEYQSSSKVLTIKHINMDLELKLKFKDPKFAVEWNGILRNSVANYLNNQTENNILAEIYSNESNRFCADCGVCDPTWVSINICVSLCDNCVGLHRSLTVEISRTQSTIIDEKCWKDKLLVQLIKNIGNETANGFWCKNLAPGDRTNAVKKYKEKQFMDTTYVSLGLVDRIDKLRLSVATNDIIETMKLWFSCESNFERGTVENLLEIARQSDQKLQEKFLSLQSVASESPRTDGQNLVPLFDAIFHLSSSNCGKFPHIYLVTLYNNQITIQKENPNILRKETVDICTIYLNNIIRAMYSGNGFHIYFYPQTKFIIGELNRSNSFTNITNLSFTDSTNITLIDFKRNIFNLLLQNCFAPVTEETSLFLITDLQINNAEVTKCHCHVTRNELVLCSSLDTKYDLRKIESMKISEGKMKVIINIAKDNILLLTNENSQAIYNFLKEASEIRLVTLNEVHFDKLIYFIKYFGLKLDRIFEINGEPEKVDNLFSIVVTREEKFCINSAEFSAHDAVSCLKKCLVLLEEPLIPASEYRKFQLAAYTESDVEKTQSYKDSLAKLPSSHLNLLNHLIELLFMITKMSDYNKMDSGRLAKAMAQFILSPDNCNWLDNCAILQYFIEKFVYIFNYSTEDQTNLVIFLDKILIPPQSFVQRQFCIDHTLSNDTNSLIKDTEELKLDFFTKSNSFTSIKLMLNNFVFVNDLYSHVFQAKTECTVKLWHFTYVKDKVYKCLLYGNDRIDNVIGRRSNFPEKYHLDRQIDLYIFLPVNNIVNILSSNNSFTYYIKILGERNSIIKTNPKRTISISSSFDSLEIRKFDSTIADYKFKLSNVNLYRAHGSESTIIYILESENTVVSCDFKNINDFNDFFIFFDKFKSQNRL